MLISMVVKMITQMKHHCVKQNNDALKSFIYLFYIYECLSECMYVQHMNSL